MAIPGSKEGTQERYQLPCSLMGKEIDKRKRRSFSLISSWRGRGVVREKERGSSPPPFWCCWGEKRVSKFYNSSFGDTRRGRRKSAEGKKKERNCSGIWELHRLCRGGVRERGGSEKTKFRFGLAGRRGKHSQVKGKGGIWRRFDLGGERGREGKS